MSLVEKCWMITSNVSVIAVLIITGICFGIFMITIKNSYQGELNYSDSDLPKTTKSGKGHGIGLNNIRRVAKMYMGDISLEQVDKEVILSIMLQVE